MQLQPLLIAGAVAVLIVLLLPATYMELKARRHLSTVGEQNPWLVYVLGPFADKRYFTEAGWDYHKRARWFGAPGGILFVALLLIALWLHGRGA